MTIIEILIVVAIVGILMLIAMPNFVAMRNRAQKDICVNNLRQIKLAKEQWALGKDKLFTDTPVAEDLDEYVKDGTAGLVCPKDTAKTFGTSYTINNVGTDPACNISSDHML